jgi:quercetin 2,3-dioxygenase
LTDPARQGHIEPQQEQALGTENLLLCEYTGEEVWITLAETTRRFRLISGKPFAELIAWYGLRCHETKHTLETAFPESREGTFLPHGEVAS